MKVLFVVPTLGERPDMLAQCLESVRSQALAGLDLVVVAPQGRHVEEVAEAAGARFVEDPGRGGLSGALNAALATAPWSVEYFAWLGDDDLLTPGSLSATTRALDDNPDAVLAYGWCDYIDESGRLLFRNRVGWLAGVILPISPNLVPQPGSLMRLAAVMAAGGLDEGLSLTMDLDLFLRLRRRGRLVALPFTLARFRWHTGSTTVALGQLSMDEADQVRMRYMSRPGALAYRLLRWPGRWALSTAKRRVTNRVGQPVRTG